MSTHSKPEKTGQASDLGISKAIFIASMFGPLIATISSPMLWFLLFNVLQGTGSILLIVFVVSQLATWLAAPLAWLWTRIGYVSFVSALIAGTVLGTAWTAVMSDFLNGGEATNFTDLVIFILGFGVPFGVSGACVFWAVQNREHFVSPGAQLKQMLFGFRFHIMTVLVLNFLTSGIGLIVMGIYIDI